MRVCTVAVAVLAALLCLPGISRAETTPSTALVPPLIRYAGTLKGKIPGTVGMTFALYRDQSGGAPLWLETQNVEVGENGTFSVVLGAAHAGGIPTDLFSSGEARWLGIQVEGEPEQDRILLVSVPYALKAADADTLGGKPLSAFVLADSQSAASSTKSSTSALAVGSTTDVPMAMTTQATIISGIPNYLPKFADATSLTSSRIFESSGNVGVGTTTPESILDVGMNSAQTVRFGALPWSLRFGSLQNGTQFIGISVKKKAADNNYVASSQNIAGVNHTVMEFHYDGSVRIKQQAHQADGTVLAPTTSFSVVGNGNVGIGVDKATQKLEVSGNVKIDGTGNGLIFPDGTSMKTAVGAISGITAGSGLKGGGTTGTPVLELDTTYTDARYMRVDSAVIQTVNAGIGISETGAAANPVLTLDTNFTDSRYIRAGANNTFTGDQRIEGNLSVNGALASGPQVITGDVAASGTVSGTTINGGLFKTQKLQAQLGADTGDASGISVSVGSDTATGIEVTSSSTAGTATGIHSSVNSPYAFAGIFDNIAAGNILLGRIKVGDYWVKKFRVDGNGKVYSSGGYLTGGADFAESFAVAGEKSAYEPADVMVIDTSAVRRLARSQQPYSTLVAGVYSTRPGITASPYDMDNTNLEKEVPLAVIGVVPCKVTDENGPIAIGDLLVTSSTPGHAMKGTDRSRMTGAVVGKALQPLPSGTGVIEVLVTLQ